MNSKITIFIDESGTLPDIKDKVIVVAAVGTYLPETIDKVFKDLKKKGKLKGKTGELKFYTAGEKTKELFFKNISKEDFKIFVLVVEKMGRKIPDTPNHFALICWLLLSDVFNFYPNCKEIIFDKHFSNLRNLNQFNETLENLIPHLPPILHVNSRNVKRVNIADMVAGAILSNETGKNVKYYQMLERRIISEKKINWTEAKNMFVTKKLV